jgi:(4S)-4-hydroxy-5-phosphonooxypentane-2,3-dione isomerase
MHVVIVKWLVKADHLDAFLETIRWHIDSTRKNEPGCLRFDLCQEEDNPRAFWLYEVYQDDAALAAHAQSASLPKLRENIPLWVEERTLVKTSLIYPESA